VALLSPAIYQVLKQTYEVSNNLSNIILPDYTVMYCSVYLLRYEFYRIFDFRNLLNNM